MQLLPQQPQEEDKEVGSRVDGGGDALLYRMMATALDISSNSSSQSCCCCCFSCCCCCCHPRPPPPPLPRLYRAHGHRKDKENKYLFHSRSQCQNVLKTHPFKKRQGQLVVSSVSPMIVYGLRLPVLLLTWSLRVGGRRRRRREGETDVVYSRWKYKQERKGGERGGGGGGEGGGETHRNSRRHTHSQSPDNNGGGVLCSAQFCAVWILSGSFACFFTHLRLYDYSSPFRALVCVCVC